MLYGFGVVFSSLLQDLRHPHVLGTLVETINLLPEVDNFCTPEKDLLRNEFNAFAVIPKCYPFTILTAYPVKLFFFAKAVAPKSTFNRLTQ